MESIEHHIAQAAAALVVDEGMDMENAKRRAIKQLGLPPRTRLPGNDLLEEAIHEHIRIFHADTQPAQLRALRELALQWMERLTAFSPLIGGAVWQGTATQLSDIHLQLFADDPKEPLIMLLNEGLEPDAQEARGFHGKTTQVLQISVPCPALQMHVGLHLWINDPVALRGALQSDARAQPPRGTAASLRTRMAEEAAQ